MKILLYEKSVRISKSFKKSINHVRSLTQKGPFINLGRSLNMTTASIIKHKEEKKIILIKLHFLYYYFQPCSVFF